MPCREAVAGVSAVLGCLGSTLWASEFDASPAAFLPAPPAYGGRAGINSVRCHYLGDQGGSLLGGFFVAECPALHVGHLHLPVGQSVYWLWSSTGTSAMGSRVAQASWLSSWAFFVGRLGVQRFPGLTACSACSGYFQYGLLFTRMLGNAYGGCFTIWALATLLLLGLAGNCCFILKGRPDRSTFHGRYSL